MQLERTDVVINLLVERTVLLLARDRWCFVLMLANSLAFPNLQSDNAFQKKLQKFGKQQRIAFIDPLHNDIAFNRWSYLLSERKAAKVFISQWLKKVHFIVQETGFPQSLTFLISKRKQGFRWLSGTGYKVHTKNPIE